MSSIRSRAFFVLFFPRVVMCEDHDKSSVMLIPWNLKLFTCSTPAPLLKTGDVSMPPSFSKIHNQQLGLADVEQ